MHYANQLARAHCGIHEEVDGGIIAKYNVIHALNVCCKNDVNSSSVNMHEDTRWPGLTSMPIQMKYLNDMI